MKIQSFYEDEKLVTVLLISQELNLINFNLGSKMEENKTKFSKWGIQKLLLLLSSVFMASKNHWTKQDTILESSHVNRKGNNKDMQYSGCMFIRQ